MRAVKATYDGTQFLLDEPIIIPANRRAIIILLDQDDEEWYSSEKSSLNQAYSPEEPEYHLSSVGEPNPLYD